MVEICLECYGYGTDDGCKRCLLKTENLFHKNPEQPKNRCTRCGGMGNYFKPCEECGLEVCKGSYDEYEMECNGHGLPLKEGCPSCGEQYPLYTPQIPVARDEELVQALAIVKTKAPHMLKTVQENAKGWVPEQIPNVKFVEFIKSENPYDDCFPDGEVNQWGYDEAHDKGSELMIKILENEGLTDECENPEFGGFWKYETDLGETQKVYMYSNGGDAFLPGVLFYRIDNNGKNFVHVPLWNHQESLRDKVYAVGYFETKYDRGEEGSNAVSLVSEYLDAIVNISMVWRPI